MQQRQHSRDEKEDAIHNSQREASLQHRTRLIHMHVQAVHAGGTKDAKRDVVAGAGGDVAAVGMYDEAQLVDGGNEGADKTEIN